MDFSPIYQGILYNKKPFFFFKCVNMWASLICLGFNDDDEPNNWKT